VSQRRDAPTEGRRTRAELWDERHAARDPIESRSADPTLVEEAGADGLFTPDETVRDLPGGFLVRRTEVVRRAGSVPGPIDAVVRAERPDTRASKPARSASPSPLST